jgi:glycine cleavage system H protein
MPEFLVATIDKFTFRVATDRRYTADGVWVQPLEGNRLRLGVTDYLQQHSGDVAFVSARPRGTRLMVEEEFAALETIKVNLSLPSPVAGTVAEINDALDAAPERINQDPYGEGWVMVIEPANWNTERGQLLDPDGYFAIMQAQVAEELEQP